MTYQDRKDIDTLYDIVWDKDSNQTQFITREEFNNFLNYIKSNYTLSAITDTISSNIDSNGLVILENLKDGLGELETNIDGLERNLSGLSLQLNGDNNNSGFIDLLTELQSYMYGEGESDTDGNPYTYIYPSSDSLKGLINALTGQLGNLQSGDTKLSITLSTLSSKLQRFSGTLTQFRTQIQTEYPNLELDSDLIALIYEIASSNQAIYEHQQSIQQTEALIGSPTDSASNQGTPQNPVTLYGKLNDTSVLASDVNDSANDLIDTLYRGTGNDYDPNATPTSPADNTTIKKLNQTKSTAERVDGLVGDTSVFTEQTISQALQNRKNQENIINNKIGDTGLFSGDSISEALSDGQADMLAWERKVGNVDVSTTGNLQQQIADIINNLIFGNGTGCVIVNSIEDRDNLNPRLYRTCYVKATGKFYAYTGEDILGG